MSLNDKQLSLLGITPRLVGFRYLPFLGAPESAIATNNEIELTKKERARAAAEEKAAAASEDRAEELEAETAFNRSIRVGRVVKPGKMTRQDGTEVDFSKKLAGYQYVMKQNNGMHGLHFSQAYGAFDDIIVRKCGATEGTGHSKIAAFNPNHPNYADFAPLRRNIALLRNYLFVQMFPDGEFLEDGKSAASKEDLARYEMINNMAEHLGAALASTSGSTPSFFDRWSNSMKNVLKGQGVATPYTNAFMEAANIPDKGAAVMYNYLQGLHETPSFRNFLNKNESGSWPLKPREETVFSDDNLREYGRSSRMAGATDAYEDIVMAQLRAPENLKPTDQKVSVDIARDILEKLKNLIANPDEQARVNSFTDENQDKNQKLLTVANGFREALAVIADAEPEAIQNNKIIEESKLALETLGYRMKVNTHKALMQEYEFTAAEELKKEMDKTPAQYKTDEPTEQLLGKVDKGLQEAARIQQQARIAARIATRRAQRQSEETRRQTSAAIRSMRNGPKTEASFNKAMKEVKGLGGNSGGLGMDTMGAVRVSAASENGKPLVDTLIEEVRPIAPLLNDNNRGR